MGKVIAYTEEDGIMLSLNALEAKIKGFFTPSEWGIYKVIMSKCFRRKKMIATDAFFANVIKVSRKTVARTLKKWEGQGLLKLQYKKVYPDKKAMREIKLKDKFFQIY